MISSIVPQQQAAGWDHNQDTTTIISRLNRPSTNMQQIMQCRVVVSHYYLSTEIAEKRKAQVEARREIEEAKKQAIEEARR